MHTSKRDRLVNVYEKEFAQTIDYSAPVRSHAQVRRSDGRPSPLAGTAEEIALS